jgi:hypothetical protein
VVEVPIENTGNERNARIKAMIGQNGTKIMIPHKDDFLTLDRAYIEGRCWWVESYSRVGRWLVDKQRTV